MQQGNLFNNKRLGLGNGRFGLDMPRKTIVGIILLTALVAFEIFNFDTTRFALQNLLGEVSFWGLAWSSILALAFCAIDFAGLARLFTPEQGADEPKAVWYLMGAWLLGATMNAIMTWWAVSLTLLSHDLGNEVLSRQQLLQIAPIFVAVLVWLTRILFIGALSVTGEHMFDLAQPTVSQTAAPHKQAQPLQSAVHANRPTATAAQPSRINRRIRQQPPIPNGVRQTPVGMHAQSNRKQ
ncbi:MAG: hypothetical protein H6658_08720 [Ardenticatenaceae bacterium]|nr:hypothetical protein [Ardenticatenaceae bacterium]